MSKDSKTPIIQYNRVNPGFLRDSLDSIIKASDGNLVSTIEGPTNSYITYVYDIAERGGIICNIFYSPYAVKFSNLENSNIATHTTSGLSGIVSFLGFKKDDFYHKLYYNISSIGD